MDFYALTISEIKKETENAISISFNIPDNLKQKYTFIAGQYVTLKAIINDAEIRRDYSLCSTPSSGSFKVVVKRVPEGVFSEFANTLLKEGDSLDVSTPNGRFTFEANPALERNIIAFAAGSGITPVMSIIKTALEVEQRSNVTLIYGNKTINDTIFFEELKDLKQQYDDRFLLQFVYSQSSEADALFGRIEGSSVNYILNKVANPNLFYLCGPEAMIKTVSDTLIEKGYDKDTIKFELFTTAASTSDPTDKDVVPSGETHVTVLVDDEEEEFSMSQSKTVLEAALENKVDAPYSCQGGICSSCIARLTSGEVKMRQNNILTDGEVAEGLILTCQAQPITSKIVVDYDDV